MQNHEAFLYPDVSSKGRGLVNVKDVYDNCTAHHIRWVVAASTDYLSHPKTRRSIINTYSFYLYRITLIIVNISAFVVFGITSLVILHSSTSRCYNYKCLDI